MPAIARQVGWLRTSTTASATVRVLYSSCRVRIAALVVEVTGRLVNAVVTRTPASVAANPRTSGLRMLGLVTMVAKTTSGFAVVGGAAPDTSGPKAWAPAATSCAAAMNDPGKSMTSYTIRSGRHDQATENARSADRLNRQVGNISIARALVALRPMSMPVRHGVFAASGSSGNR